MILILSAQTLLGPKSLVARNVPRQVLSRGRMPIPRGTVRTALFWRVIFEISFLRYVAALLPFLLAMLIWPEAAFGLAQAPLPMFLCVYLVETRVLAIPSKARRQALIDADEAARARDLLQLRARKILAQIAAGRQMQDGVLYLVVEQSAMARVAPLTILSVQPETRPSFLNLDAQERATLKALFDEALSERLLQRVNLAENRFIRSVAFEARGVSAHARLAALATEAQR
ncbi:MAG: hypothetical protein AAGC92_09895 [Pseudomonadota bacterium]